MKKSFFTLLAILIIVVIGFLTYLKFSSDKHTSDDKAVSENITAQPTQAPTAAPTVTPLPMEEASEITTELYPAYQIIDGNQKYGYVDTKGKFVIQPEFDTASDFHDGLAVVYLKDKYAVINSAGSILYRNDGTIEDYQNGAAVIARYSGDNILYGYIDTKGQVIIKPQYSMVSNFGKDDFAYVATAVGEYAKIDKSGKVLETYELNKKYESAWSIQDGYVVYSTAEGNYGVVNLQGVDIFKPDYCDITYLGNDLFALKKPDPDVFGAYDVIPAGLFNAKGEQLTDFTLYDISRFHDGYASVTDSKNTYFIGTDGKEASDLPKFDGRGSLTMYGNTIKAVLDKDLLFCKKDGTVFWQNDTTQKLSDSITVKSIKFKPNKYVVVYYPELDGLADSAVQRQINNTLKSVFLDNRVNMKEEDMMSVDDSFTAKLTKNLLILDRDGYDFGFGAAHGMPIMDYYYIDITTGTFYQFMDLFLAGSDYAAKINSMINAQIAAQTANGESMYFDGSFTGIVDQPNFILSEDSLTIYFYPYDIAAYAAGFPQFEIPFKDIYEYIDLKGAFWNSFK